MELRDAVTAAEERQSGELTSAADLLWLGGVRLALGFYEEVARARLLLMRVVGACGARISGQSLGKRGFSARVVTGSDLS